MTPAPRADAPALALPCALLFGAMLNLTLVVAGLKELVIGELGGSTADAALFFTVEMAAYLVWAPVWGALSDRLGRRRPLIAAGFAASGLAYLGYLGVESIPVLLGLRFLQGAAAIAGWSTTLALLFDHADAGSRPRVSGLAGAAMILGVGLGAPAGGVLTAAVGPRAPLAAAGGLFLLLAAASLGLREAAATTARPRLGAIGRALAARPRLLLPWSFYLVERFTVGLFVVFFPLLLADRDGVDPAARGRALALFLLPFAFAQLVSYRLMRRFGPLPPLALGVAGYGLAFALLPRLPADATAPLLVAMGMLASVIFPPTLALTAEWTAPETRASALAGFNVAGSLGFALGPVAGAWVERAWGPTAPFDLAAAAALAAALAAAGALARRRA